MFILIIYTCTCSHTHHTHKHMYRHTYTHRRIHTYLHMYHIYTTYAYTDTDVYTDITYVYTARPYTHTHVHTCTHIHTYIYTHRHTQTHVDTHTLNAHSGVYGYSWACGCVQRLSYRTRTVYPGLSPTPPRHTTSHVWHDGQVSCLQCPDKGEGCEPTGSKLPLRSGSLRGRCRWNASSRRQGQPSRSRASGGRNVGWHRKWRGFCSPRAWAHVAHRRELPSPRDHL